MNDQRKAHWEQVYQSKESDQVSWFQPSPECSLKMIEDAAIAVDEAIIDLGGGTSRLVDALIDRGYHNISVLDISAAALENSRRRLGDRATQVNWLESDVTEFTLSQPVGLWHDRAVFHFLTAAGDRQAYLERLERYLVVGGHLIIATFSPQGPTQCSGLDIVQYDYESLQKTLGSGYQLIDSIDEQHQTPAGKIQHFNYFHFTRTH